MEFNIKSVEEMTVDELIGQVIMIGLPGKELDSEYKDFIKKYKIGNYILFARNYDNTKQMKKLMKDLYNYTYSVTGSFPLVSIDQEGGMVVRLFKDLTFPASPLSTSASSVKDAPYISGKIIGSDMIKMGINLNLAPCLEINKNLSNHLVNVRSYGSSKDMVLRNARLFVRGLQDSSVLSCIKHFPGDGSSEIDSHLELPIIDDSKEELLNYNMYPFINLKESDALMTSHCVYTSFDDLASTVSPVLLNDILRKEIGFEGLIISDGMEMKAITDTYGLGEGCIRALNAGCDILLLCHEYSEQVEAFETVKKAVCEGKIKIDTLKEKIRRINLAKEKLKDALIKNFNDAEYEVVSEEHMIMQEIVDNSYTLIKGKKPYVNNKTLILSSNAKIASIVEDEFDERNLTNALKHNFPNNTIIKFSKEDNFIDNVLDIVDEYDNILIYSYDAYNDYVQKECINRLLDTEKEVFVISLKGPMDRKCFNNLKNYACLYEYTPNSIKTVIKQLMYNLDLNGRLPIE